MDLREGPGVPGTPFPPIILSKKKKKKEAQKKEKPAGQATKKLHRNLLSIYDFLLKFQAILRVKLVFQWSASGLRDRCGVTVKVTYFRKASVSVNIEGNKKNVYKPIKKIPCSFRYRKRF